MTEPAESPVLARITRGKLCSGCGGCAAVAPAAISMVYDSAGFLRPQQRSPLPEGAEDVITDICPGVGLTVETGNRRTHPLWGPYISVHRCNATDAALRHHASSGGGLSAVLCHLLATGAVNQVLQVGPDPHLPIGNRVVISTTPEDVLANSGSRYAPSAPLAAIAPLLDGNDRTAFVGKPCDVAALRAMARIDSRIDVRFPYMISFYCAGVPSLEGAREVLDRLSVTERDVAKFRYRGDGWPGYATATSHTGETARMSYADSWGGILSRHVQFRCKICPDGTASFADIVFADAWEADDKGYPLFDEREGISLVMTRTDKGEELLHAAAASGTLSVSPFALETLESIQPGQRGKRQLTLPRITALAVFGRPRPMFRGFDLAQNARNAGLRDLIKNFLGTLRRVISGRL